MLASHLLQRLMIRNREEKCRKCVNDLEKKEIQIQVLTFRWQSDHFAEIVEQTLKRTEKSIRVHQVEEFRTNK